MTTQSFRVRPSNTSVLEGQEIILRCEVNNRVGIVQWVKDGFAYVIEPSKHNFFMNFVPSNSSKIRNKFDFNFSRWWNSWS